MASCRNITGQEKSVQLAALRRQVAPLAFTDCWAPMTVKPVQLALAASCTSGIYQRLCINYLPLIGVSCQYMEVCMWMAIDAGVRSVFGSILEPTGSRKPVWEKQTRKSAPRKWRFQAFRQHWACDRCHWSSVKLKSGPGSSPASVLNRIDHGT